MGERIWPGRRVLRKVSLALPGKLCGRGGALSSTCTVTGSQGPFASLGRRPRVAAESRGRGAFRKRLRGGARAALRVRLVEAGRHLLAGARKAAQERGPRGPGTWELGTGVIQLERVREKTNGDVMKDYSSSVWTVVSTYLISSLLLHSLDSIPLCKLLSTTNATLGAVLDFNKSLRHQPRPQKIVTGLRRNEL